MPTCKSAPMDSVKTLKTQNPPILLASGSSYRKELLQRLQLNFIAQAPDIDETALPGESPLQTSQRLAVAKAQALSADYPNHLIIGSDQVANLGNLHIGKPGNHQRALEQLMLMKGKVTTFHTALCLLDTRPGSKLPWQTDVISVELKMRDLSAAEFDAYLRIEQPYDCAGSAKNEGLGISLIEFIKSEDPSALTGLPLISLTSMLRKAGVQFYAIQE